MDHEILFGFLLTPHPHPLAPQWGVGARSCWRALAKGSVSTSKQKPPARRCGEGEGQERREVMLSRYNLCACDSPIEAHAYPSTGVIEVPGDLALQQSDLIEGVLALAFDVLGCTTLQMRVRQRPEHV